MACTIDNNIPDAFDKPVSPPRSRLAKTGTPAPLLPPDFKRADNFNAFAKTFGLNPADWRTRVDFLNIEAKEIREGYGNE